MKTENFIAYLCAMYLNNFCSEQTDCKNCLFHYRVDGEMECKIGNTTPNGWDVADAE